jgi:hypothetical protein
MTTASGPAEYDADGNRVLYRGSRTAASNFGLIPSTFTNIPKGRNLFYIKFTRATPAAQTASTFLTTLPLTVKSVDFPEISFKTDTLNQYNRKRIIQTKHEFGSLNVTFFDTNANAVQSLMKDYYAYYYGDAKQMTTGGTAVYDIVTGIPFNQGKFGFSPNLATGDYNYYFSQIAIYHLYQGYYEITYLINPKISSIQTNGNDYSDWGASEYKMSLVFEAMTFTVPEKITSSVASDLHLDAGHYWNVQDTSTAATTPGLWTLNQGNGAIGNILGSIATAITGSNKIGKAVNQFTGAVTGAYDPRTGLAIGTATATSVAQLVTGNSSTANTVKAVGNTISAANAFANLPGRIL